MEPEKLEYLQKPGGIQSCFGDTHLQVYDFHKF